MNAAEDDDIKLLRASTSLLADLRKLLNCVLRKRNGDVHRRVRESDLAKIYAIVEPFQEDPQLLDAHLKHFIPPLVDAYLDYIRISERPTPKKLTLPLSHAVCRILNLFCKVRGEKVIAGFLNNEPRYLEPILHEHEKGENAPTEEDKLSKMFVPQMWEERYVLFLWLSHLVLTPFPLASISALQPTQSISSTLGIDLPAELPGVVLRIIKICVEGLRSATKERSAAANLLVKLSIRPDMQKAGLLEGLVKWALTFFSDISDTLQIHQFLGVLLFLSELVTSANHEEIGQHVPAIYQSCQKIIEDPGLEMVRSSAVARKLVVKKMRNIVVHSLQTTSTSAHLDVTTVVEEVIGHLLEAVGDGDTPVRYAASKALSVITMKLDHEMAGDVVEAILGSLSENVYWQGSKRNLSGVNPLRWHGLTLTLSHLLYRRALSTDQLPEVFNALLLALAFEQRSATGGSIGTNVRDAACFGIWALARRYTTKELLAIETTSIRASQQSHHSLSVPQVVAIELLTVACLDPAGNIRRGSSAALQELIGRHPNTVEEGIPLVQVVDFHAVGLRERAMTFVAMKAAQLNHMYWEALFENLLGWRGTGSLDAASRVFAATAVGRLIRNKDLDVVQLMIRQISESLHSLKLREVEERHGLVMALALLFDEANELQLYKSMDFTQSWNLLDGTLKLDDKFFTSPALRPELTAVSMCNFLGSLSAITCQTPDSSQSVAAPEDEIIRLFNLCLGRTEESVLQAVPRTSEAVLQLLSKTSPAKMVELASTWLKQLESEQSYNRLRGSGYAIALGAAYPQLGASVPDGSSPTPTEEQMRIVADLTFRCTPSVDIAARTVALRALCVLLQKHKALKPEESLPEEVKHKIADALSVATNDYTVTERGDVGSLVRLEALNTIETAWMLGLLEASAAGEKIHADVLRLSLEKLDKIRTRAAHVLEVGNTEHFERAIKGVVEGVSSTTYFASALQLLATSTTRPIKEAIIFGLVSSVGMASESVVQNSRFALVEFLDGLPTTADSRNQISCSVLLFANILLDIFEANLTNDRVLIPLLEVLEFLFDMQIFRRLVDTDFNFRTLLSLTQKSHYKSTHMQKLHLALDLYRGLGTIPATRADTVTKVVSMLLHPFPKIRISAAETLWVLTSDEELKRNDWSLPSKSLKPAVEELRKRAGEVKV